MEGLFVVLKDGVLEEYLKYEEVPESFDNLIRCEFDYLEGPHTEEEHEHMSKYNDMLKELMRRETK